MKLKFSILIVDKNPHVREFLKREMIADGYCVRLAENGRQLLKWIYHNERLDLLILDPDLPDIDVSFLLTKLENRIPLLPVVVHTFLSGYSENSDVLRNYPLVEKRGNSIEHLKTIVRDILYESYPNRTKLERIITNSPES